MQTRFPMELGVRVDFRFQCDPRSRSAAVIFSSCNCEDFRAALVYEFRPCHGASAVSISCSLVLTRLKLELRREVTRKDTRILGMSSSS